MKKIFGIVCALVLSVSMFGESKVAFLVEPGYGELGVMMKCGAPIHYLDNYGRDAVSFGGAVFYDLALVNSGLGVLVGWDCVFDKGDDPDLNGFIYHDFKLGLRGGRFFTAGPVIGFDKDFTCNGINDVDLGGFVNLMVPFKYISVGVEYQYTRYTKHSLFATISFMIPTVRK